MQSTKHEIIYCISAHTIITQTQYVIFKIFSMFSHNDYILTLTFWPYYIKLDTAATDQMLVMIWKCANSHIVLPRTFFMNLQLHISCYVGN